MRHAIIGVGGVGGLIAGALARAGQDVLLVRRRQTLDKYRGTLTLESVVLGDFAIPVPAAPILNRPVDVVWFTTKATHLNEALAFAPPAVVGGAPVVPLLNGIDHVNLLRLHYETVIPGTIRVESEQVTPELIRQKSPFLQVELATTGPIVDELVAAGIPCEARDDETTMLWEKLAFLVPVALATTATGATLGEVRSSRDFIGCRAETVSVALAEGANLKVKELDQLHLRAPGDMRSSMQKDVAAGRKPELSAIADPVLRGGARHDIPTPSTALLVAGIRARLQEEETPVL